MSADAMISVENLGKRYTLKHQAAQGLLRDRVADALAAPARWLKGRRSVRSTANSEDFWALRDLSFSVKQGEVLGIIGRNGAGKSTLLKILSRITEPTKGRVTINGRVASLLEVGTGFHPELSGRENIYLNGAILGMSRAEIHRKFDEIVAFADVEKFLDTAVKHYSSGMYVRLAFAVAAHLEPEILIVDEVLAVGDASFQQKCLGKMRDVASSQGRTVLFVSHNSGALAAICRSGLWLKQGQIAYQGTIRDTIARYHQAGAASEVHFAPVPDRPSITSVAVDEVALRGGDWIFRVGFASPVPLRPAVVGIIVKNKVGQPVCGANTRMLGDKWQAEAAAGTITARLERPPMHSESFSVSVWLGDAGGDFDAKLDVIAFDFISNRFYANLPPVDIIGPVDIPWAWTLEKSS